jgi:hypothetical protein
MTTALTGLVLAGTALAAVPSNDTFASAPTISSLPFSDTVDTTEATTDSDDKAAGVACGVSGGRAELHSPWYDYTPSSNQTIRIDTSGFELRGRRCRAHRLTEQLLERLVLPRLPPGPGVGRPHLHILAVDFSAGTGGTLRL